MIYVICYLPYIFLVEQHQKELILIRMIQMIINILLDKQYRIEDIYVFEFIYYDHTLQFIYKNDLQDINYLL